MVLLAANPWEVEQSGKRQDNKQLLEGGGGGWNFEGQAWRASNCSFHLHMVL